VSAANGAAKPSPARTRFTLPVIAASAGTLVLWASAFAAIRYALAGAPPLAGPLGYPPAQLAALRFLIASGVLVVIALVMRLRLPALKDLPMIVLAGTCAVPLYHVALNIGETVVTSGAASLIIASQTVYVAILASIFLGERVSKRGWLGIAVAFAGVALIAVGESGGIRISPEALWVLAAAVAAAAYFVLQKPLLRTYGALEVTCYTLWAGTVLMIPFMVGLPTTVARAPVSATLSVVYLGVFPAAIAYVMWNYVLKHLPSTAASSLLYISPVLAIIIGFLWLGELPSPLAFVGGALSVGGVVLVNLRGAVTSRAGRQAAADASARAADPEMPIDGEPMPSAEVLGGDADDGSAS
jgi:drug/metabolite transporter (DMT)-like permease